MALDRETRREIEGLKAIIRDLQSGQRRQAASLRTPQLGHSSIESGALEVRDPESGQRMRIGIIDGRVGTTTEGGDPVSSPSAPSVTPSLGGLRVTWDGTLSGDVAIPVDFDHMAVHVSTSPGFTPSAATYVGSIRRAGEGGMLPVVPLPYVEHYVRLVPVTTGGVQGVPSAEVAATPLQTSGVDLQADSVEAVHIKAGAVEADKLEAVLVLASTIIAGIPGAARVELDQDGLRGYNEANELIFAIDSAGNAVFSGDITGSEITGSRFALVDPEFGEGIYIEQLNGFAPRLLIYTGADDGPGIVAQNSSIEVRSSIFGIGAPSIKTQAFGTSAVQTVEASSAVDAARIRTRATGDSAHFEISPPFSGSGGTVYGYVKSTGAPAIGYTSPAGGTYPYQSSQIELEGSHDGRAASQATYWADQHIVLRGANATGADGVWALDDAVSLLANRHAPLRSDMASNPSFTTTGAFVSFTSGQMPPISFKTGWSGRIRVTITAAGSNSATSGSQIDLGFSLSGGSTVPAARARSWIGTASVVQHGSRVVHLNLAGNADYTLTPAWRITSGSSSTASYVLSFENSIVVEPLT